MFNSKIEQILDAYPHKAAEKLRLIRQAIFEIAEQEKLGLVTETLKWGEPSYLVKQGSTIRINWKQKSPNSVSIYFNCQSKLIETFREVYSDSFEYIGNREMVIAISEELSVNELKHCLSTALRYHQIKNLTLLGM